MNAKQRSAIYWLTQRIQNTWHPLINGGAMLYKVEQVTGNAVMVQAFNQDERWFDNHVHVLAFVGPRGGIEIKICEGMSRKMLRPF